MILFKSKFNKSIFSSNTVISRSFKLPPFFKPKKNDKPQEDENSWSVLYEDWKTPEKTKVRAFIKRNEYWIAASSIIAIIPIAGLFAWLSS